VCHTIQLALRVWGGVQTLASAHVLHQSTTQCLSISGGAKVQVSDWESSEAGVEVPKGECRVLGVNFSVQSLSLQVSIAKSWR